ARRFPKMRLIFRRTGVTVYSYSNYRAGMIMHTSNYANRLTSFSSSAGNSAQKTSGRVSTGLISEIVYREDQPLMTQLLLLPLLQQLGQQSRWQLWLTPQQKLSREWVQSAGLPLTKMMQSSLVSPCHTVDSMVRA